MSANARFTASGGLIIPEAGDRLPPIRLVVTTNPEAIEGTRDDSVELTEDEAFELGCWLLRQALPSNDWDAVRRRINNTPWKRDRDRDEQQDAMAAADALHDRLVDEGRS